MDDPRLAREHLTGTGPRPAAAGRRGPGGWAALGVVWLVWGSTYLAIRIADESIQPFPMAAFRYLAAGALLYPVARRGGGRALRASDRPGLAQWAAMALVGTMLLAFGNGGVTYAERTLPSGLAALLVASVPLWMALADWVINGRRIRPAGWAALAAGLAGVAILARPHGHGSAVAVAAVLAAAMSWGVGSVLAGRLPASARPLLGSAMEMLAGGVALVVMAALTGQLTRFDPARASGGSVLAVLYLIGPGSLLAMTCYVIALRRLPVTVVSTYAYVNPVIAVSLGALVLGERLTVASAAGGVVVVASVAALLLSRRPAPALPGEDASEPPA